jgi:hypothetical protein
MDKRISMQTRRLAALTVIGGVLAGAFIGPVSAFDTQGRYVVSPRCTQRGKQRGRRR